MGSDLRLMSHLTAITSDKLQRKKEELGPGWDVTEPKKNHYRYTAPDGTVFTNEKNAKDHAGRDEGNQQTKNAGNLGASGNGGFPAGNKDGSAIHGGVRFGGAAQGERSSQKTPGKSGDGTGKSRKVDGTHMVLTLDIGNSGTGYAQAHKPRDGRGACLS